MKILLYVALAYLGFEVLRITRLGLIAVKFGKSTKLYTQFPLNSTTQLLVVGDSLGVGVGASNPSFSLAGRLGQALPHATITNYSLSGATVSMAHNYLRKHELKNYDFTLLFIGGMDALQFVSASQFEKKLRELLSLLRKHSQNIALILPFQAEKLPIYNHFPTSLIVHYRVMKLRQIAQQVSQEFGVTLIPDTFNEVLSDRKHTFFKDQAHPNDLGYKLWFTQLWKHLEPLINKK